MIIRVFKFTKLPQVIAAIIISILIMLAFKNIDNLVAEIYSLSLLVAIFFLSLFIISKNSILKNNQYISLGLIIFCGVYFKMPSEINITASYLFLLLSISDVIFSFIEETSLIIFLPFDLSYNPSTSENSISISAPII